MEESKKTQEGLADSGEKVEEKKTQAGASGSDENLYAILAYLWVLCLVPIILKKGNDFVKFHVRQGLMLFIIEVGLGIIGIVPALGRVVVVLGTIVCGLLSLVGIVQVLMGNRWKIPVIGDWAEKLKI